MPFFSKEDLNKLEKVEVMNDRVVARNDTMKVHELTKKDDDKGLYEAIEKARTKSVKPKPITMKDIEMQYKIDDYVEDRIQNEQSVVLHKSDFKEMHEGLIDILAMPHKEQRANMLFKEKLHKSDVINEYLSNNIILRIGYRMNDHAKAAIVYGLKYHQVNQEMKINM